MILVCALAICLSFVLAYVCVCLRRKIFDQKLTDLVMRSGSKNYDGGWDDTEFLDSSLDDSYYFNAAL